MARPRAQPERVGAVAGLFVVGSVIFVGTLFLFSMSFTAIVGMSVVSLLAFPRPAYAS